MSGGQQPDEPTRRLSSGPPGGDGVDDGSGRTAQPKPEKMDPQATIWEASAQPTQQLDPHNQPTQQLFAGSDATQWLDVDHPTELLGAQEPAGYLPPPVLAPPNPSTRSGAYPTARWFHGATALVAWVALGLQLVLVVAAEGVDASLVPAIIDYLSQFTFLAGLVVALVVSALATNPIRQSSSFGPLRLDSVVMISMSSLIYLVVENPTFNSQGWQVVADIALYYVVPILALAGYGLFGPRPRFSFRDILPAMVIPAVWALYTLLYGVLSGSYDYSFMNAESLGYERVGVNLVWMLVVALLLSFGFIMADKKLPWAPRR